MSRFLLFSTEINNFVYPNWCSICRDHLFPHLCQTCSSSTFPPQILAFSRLLHSRRILTAFNLKLQWESQMSRKDVQLHPSQVPQTETSLQATFSPYAPASHLLSSQSWPKNRFLDDKHLALYPHYQHLWNTNTFPQRCFFHGTCIFDHHQVGTEQQERARGCSWWIRNDMKG